MALPGELKGLDGTTCECGKKLELEVWSSAAGYYLGYFCPRCGPYSRETGYFESYGAALLQLQGIKMGMLPDKIRDTDYHPQGE